MTNDKIEALLQRGIWMGDDGPSSWALTLDQVQLVLNELEQTSVPVLGGDVYEHEDGALRPAYMNWHSDPRTDEAKHDFVARSLAETRAYLNSIAGNAGNYMYVLVLGEARTSESVQRFQD